ncbi:gliding motility-associated peptidyl-prolyl isomerase GldI [Polaribacter gangjinensis]|uniref:Peptidyl-prolyl cis-trans isomerase n=1 Tax=Polaribacter gangjinensis TaxID=574710 RepID=A0A2S7W930_9FLAO|nr:gliding motility-associated peptidyl-prolyl isomerase GldI [Polaribacter gangjinensis]PQJ74128.1 gliding motility-associated peptidyl-prolyl isomerase GldI [Polaribacter gangjinensis]
MKVNSFFLLSFIFLLSCSKIEPRRPINPKPSTTIYKEVIEDSKKINKAEDEMLAELIKKDTLLNFKQSSQGFWYAYNHQIQENLPTPKLGDEVVIVYQISDLNDAIIYSKEELGQKTYKIDKEDFISGLQKGIKLMKTGETITFVLPFYNAFGVLGDGNKIGVNQSIKITVTLIKITN